MTKILNPLTAEPVADDVAEYIGQIHEVRRNAKKASRSGNPAKRYPAIRVLGQVPHLIGAAYRRDAVRKMQGLS